VFHVCRGGGKGVPSPYLKLKNMSQINKSEMLVSDESIDRQFPVILSKGYNLRNQDTLEKRLFVKELRDTYESERSQLIEQNRKAVELLEGIHRLHDIICYPDDVKEQFKNEAEAINKAMQLVSDFLQSINQK
jgi:hypothetical protein